MAHKSVMLGEVLEILCKISNSDDNTQTSDKRVYVDCTFGAGGHSEALLIEDPVSELYAFDRDTSVRSYAQKLEEKYDKRFHFQNAKFTEIKKTLEVLYGICKVDRVLMDLGVSSMQLDQEERGFSFMRDGPLNMRMGQGNVVSDTGINSQLNAEYIVNNYDKYELERIIREYGEEYHALKIADAICKYRQNKKISRTLQLSDIVMTVFNTAGKDSSRNSSKIHPATKTFQALRIAVNDELVQIESGVKDMLEILNYGGILCVITFHSLEDSIVKNIFQNITKKIKTNKYKPSYSKNDIIDTAKFIKGGPLFPSREEVLENARSRSAKLRYIIKN